MARVTGPLMSIDASGSIASTIVYSKWRGRNYVRRHAIPANPRSGPQLAARAVIAFLGRAWETVTVPNRATWEDVADAAKISPFNAFVARGAKDWRDGWAPSEFLPATRTQIPGVIGVLACTLYERQISIDLSYTPGGAGYDRGIVVIRSSSTIATPSVTLAVAAFAAAGGLVPFVDGPLAPGTYYYNAAVWTEDGALSTWGTQDSETVI